MGLMRLLIPSGKKSLFMTRSFDFHLLISLVKEGKSAYTNGRHLLEFHCYSLLVKENEN